MAIFKRIRDIIAASVNDLLAKAEDPEAAAAQMIREMEESIVALRKEAASAIASHKMLERRLEKATGEVDSWRENAELAVRESKDDLARKALARKKDAEALAGQIESQLAESSRLVGRLKGELARVEDKVQEARAKRETLVTKKRLAECRRDLVRSVEGARRLPGTGGFGDIIDGFDKLEEKIEREAAELEAARELDEELGGRTTAGEFDEMKRKKDLDEELAALKKRVKE
jgi:phage shock protein A